MSKRRTTITPSAAFLAYWAGSAGQSYCNAVEAGNVRVVYADPEAERLARESDALLPKWE